MYIEAMIRIMSYQNLVKNILIHCKSYNEEQLNRLSRRELEEIYQKMINDDLKG